MKKLIELGNRYASQSTWQDYALVKFCLCAMGVLIGLNLPKKYQKEATGFALGVFIATYIPLMAKVFRVLDEMMKE